jgi:alkanesulfonate monooxygenase
MESLDIIKRLWTEPFVTHKGKYYELNSAPLWPKPVQKPHPPIWFGGVSKSIIDAMVRYGDGWAPYCPSPEQFAELNANVQKLLKSVGRNPEEVEIGAVVLAHIGSSYDDARKFVEPIIKVRGSRSLDAESWDEAEKCSVFGGPDECIEKVEEYKKAGVQHLLFEMISPGAALECTKRMGKKVLPYFKEGRK